MRSNFEKLKIEIYGESHAPEIGVRLGGVLDGCELSLRCVDNLLERRKSRGELWATPRKEEDAPQIVSGLRKCGSTYVTDGEIEVKIVNGNFRPDDYGNTVTVPRPSHADYAAYAKDGRISSGGGRFSGRMTAPLCIAGGIAQASRERGNTGVRVYIGDCGSQGRELQGR